MLDEALSFFARNELWVYLILAFGAVVFFRRFLIAWQDLRGAIFGLERETAQTQLSSSAAMLVLLIVLAVIEFIIVTIIIPARPMTLPQLTPTVDLLASPTITLQPGTLDPNQPTDTPVPTEQVGYGTCTPTEVNITSPEPGEVIEGDVTIEGTADIPGFGFYKVEVSLQNEIQWRTIQAGRSVVQNGVLIQTWDTSSFSPGEYFLQLVVSDASGEAFPECQIPIRIVAPTE
jgi:hypothetical protein